VLGSGSEAQIVKQLVAERALLFAVKALEVAMAPAEHYAGETPKVEVLSDRAGIFDRASSQDALRMRSFAGVRARTTKG
jgi:hypothetical protein